MIFFDFVYLLTSLSLFFVHGAFLLSLETMILLLLKIIAAAAAAAVVVSTAATRTNNVKKIAFDHLATRTSFNVSTPSSVTTWNTIDAPKRIAITSIVVDHHSDGSWHVPSLHEKYSVGWNRTVQLPNIHRPFACNVRLYGMALESTLKGFEKGGTGYLSLEFETKHHGFKPRTYWYGFDKNETKRQHCYYLTSKGYGSEFIVRNNSSDFQNNKTTHSHTLTHSIFLTHTLIHRTHPRRWGWQYTAPSS